MAFDPALFLYLNPEVEAANPDLTADQVRDLYNARYAQDSNIQTTLALPAGFNETTFLVTSRTNAGDISGVNRVLKDLAVVGATAPNYLPLIYKPAVYRGGGQFDLFESVLPYESNIPYAPSSNDVLPGDSLLLLQDDLFRRVTTVGQVRSNSIVVSQSNGWAPGSRYVAVGIGLHDSERLARVLFSRSNVAGGIVGSNDATDGPFTRTADGRIPVSLMEVGFDPDLYRAIYADGRHLGDEEAYQQYVSFQELGKSRIGLARDIANSRFSTISDPFLIDGLEICGVSVDEVITSKQLDDRARLITERAIKTYVDQKSNYDVSPTFNGYITSYGLRVVTDPSDSNFPPPPAAASNASGSKGTSSLQALEVVDARVTSEYAGLPAFPSSVSAQLPSYTRGSLSVSVQMDAVQGNSFSTDQLTFDVGDALKLVSSADGTTRYDVNVAAVSGSKPAAYTLDTALQPGATYTITDATYQNVQAVYLKKLLFEVWRRVG